MMRRMLAIVVPLGFIQLPNLYQIPASSPNQQLSLYLPLVYNSSPPLVDVVEIGVISEGGWYPGQICMYGYVTPILSTALYEVNVAIEVCRFGNCPPYDQIDTIVPKLEATLPDQINPFYHCVLHGRYDFASFGDVWSSHASPTPIDNRVFYPLTITSYLKEGTEWDTTVSGTVRNDSGHRLKEVRMVGIAGLCSPKEAELGQTTLNPGETTNYIFQSFYCGTSEWIPHEGMLEISVQGVADP